MRKTTSHILTLAMLAAAIITSRYSSLPDLVKGALYGIAIGTGIVSLIVRARQIKTPA